MIFRRTDLRINLSWAKFDAEAAVDVRFAVVHQNPRQICKKLHFPPDFFIDKNVLSVGNSNTRNRLKRVLLRLWRSEPSLTVKRPFTVSEKFDPENFKRPKNLEDSSDLDENWQNRLQRWKPSFRKICLAVFALKPSQNFVKPSSTRRRRCRRHHRGSQLIRKLSVTPTSWFWVVVSGTAMSEKLANGWSSKIIDFSFCFDYCLMHFRIFLIFFRCFRCFFVRPFDIKGK